MCIPAYKVSSPKGNSKVLLLSCIFTKKQTEVNLISAIILFFHPRYVDCADNESKQCEVLPQELITIMSMYQKAVIVSEL